MPAETHLRPKSATEINVNFTTSKEQVQEKQEFREMKSKKAMETKWPNWLETRKRKKNLKQKQSKHFFRYGKCNVAKNGEDDNSADGELHEHGKTPKPLDGAIPKAQPNVMEPQLKIFLKENFN
jgi:hypothetical protein